MMSLNKEDLQCILERKMALQRIFQNTVPAADTVIRYLEHENPYLGHEQCNEDINRLYTAWTALDDENVRCLLQQDPVSVSAGTVVDYIFHASSATMTATQKNACLNTFLSFLEQEAPDEAETTRRAEMSEQELKEMMQEKIESFAQNTLKDIGGVLEENREMIEEPATEGDKVRMAAESKEDQFFLALAFYMEASNGNVGAEWSQPELDMVTAASWGILSRLAEDESVERMAVAVENGDAEFLKRILIGILLILVGIAAILLFIYGTPSLILGTVGDALFAYFGPGIAASVIMMLVLYYWICITLLGSCGLVAGIKEIWDVFTEKRERDALDSNENKAISQITQDRFTEKECADMFDLQKGEAKA